MSAEPDWLTIARKHGYAFPDARMQGFVAELLSTLAQLVPATEREPGMQFYGKPITADDVASFDELAREADADRATQATQAERAQVEQKKAGSLVAGPVAAGDRPFYNFWYGHMLGDLMQPPLCGISHSTARYIWDAATRFRAEGGNTINESGNFRAATTDKGEQKP